MTDVIAHRTCPLDAPENSREGIAFAASAGADVVEIDLRLSRDRVPVLSHDPITFRTTWWPLVVSWTPSSWLTRLKLRDSHETLPAFTDVLDVLPDGIDLAVDVKDGRSMGAAVDVLERAGLLDRARLWSSHPDAIGVARKRAPTQERAWLQNTETEDAALAYLRRAGEVGATAVSVMDVSLTREVVRAGHDLGLRVNSWVRTLAIQDRVLACEPDSVVTDWVREARARILAG
jgi:glycerophosphoryl diester phosphodiesterase